MAVYNVIGRMKVYEVTGKPFGNDFVPRHREGSGSISGVGSLAADYHFGGIGGFVGEGSPAASAMSVRSGDSSIVGAGSPVAYGGKSNSFDGSIIGVGSATASGTEGEAFYSAELDSVGSLTASGTSTRNSVAVTATGDGSPAASGSAKQNFYEMIVAESATANLEFCVDAAEIDSYAGSGQTWLDLSGNGNNFYRGSNSSAESYDPTFNGTAGELTANEYFSSDGGDLFFATAAHTYGIPWHKDNGICSLIAIVYRPNSNFSIYSTSTEIVSFRMWIPVTGGTPTGNLLTVDVFNASALSFRAQNTTSVPQNEFVMLASAHDESVGTDGTTVQVNATRQKFTSTYSSPSALDTNSIAAIGYSSGIKFPSGSRVACIAGWSRRLSDAELDAIYARLKLRYTTLP